MVVSGFLCNSPWVLPPSLSSLHLPVLLYLFLNYNWLAYHGISLNDKQTQCWYTTVHPCLSTQVFTFADQTARLVKEKGKGKAGYELLKYATGARGSLLEREDTLWNC